MKLQPVRSVIGDSVTINHHSAVVNTLIGNGVTIHRGCCIHDSIIEDRVFIHDGVVIGPHCYIGRGVTIHKGATIRPYVNVSPGCTIISNSTITHHVPSLHFGGHVMYYAGRDNFTGEDYFGIDSFIHSKEEWKRYLGCYHPVIRKGLLSVMRMTRQIRQQPYPDQGYVI